MAKRPGDRFGSMDALAAALESCLAEVESDEAAKPGEDTGVIPHLRPPSRAASTEAAPAPPPRQVAPPRRSGLRVAAVLLLATVILVGNLLVLEVVFDGGLPWLGGGDSKPVQVNAIVDFDPYGDFAEHPESVGAAADRDLATFWATEQYQSFDKDGVGIVLDAGSRVALASVVLSTDTPGFTAMILAGNERDGAFVDVSEEEEVGRRATFDVDTRSDSYRYYVVWITDLNTRAHVNEARAFVSG
jgi:hypothetical protein